MMQNADNSFNGGDDWIDDYDSTDTPEDEKYKFIWRTMERELMSEMIPLLIKTPNGRLRCGLKRDCFKLNPKATNPNYIKCYQFIGSMLGQFLIKDHLCFLVPMAPTFWMLLNDEEPTLEDYASEDARLQKRLEKFNLQDLAQWPNDEFWEWQDSDDKVTALEKGEYIKKVTRENFADFKKTLLKMLNDEAKE